MSDVPLQPGGSETPTALSADPTVPSLNQPARLSSRRPLWLFLIAFGAVVVVALILIVAFAPKPTPPKCPDPNEPCASSLLLPRTSSGLPAPHGAIELPPPANTGSPVLRNGITWTDPTTGMQVDWDNSTWTETAGLPPGLEVLGTAGGNIVVRVETYPAADASPDQLVSAMRDFVGTILEGVAPNTEDKNRPLHPQIGYRDAVGGYYTGFSSEGGQIVDYGVIILAASDGQSTMGYMIFTPSPDRQVTDDPNGPRLVKLVGQLVDVMLSHTWWTAPQP